MSDYKERLRKRAQELGWISSSDEEEEESLPQSNTDSYIKQLAFRASIGDKSKYVADTKGMGQHANPFGTQTEYEKEKYDFGEQGGIIDPISATVRQRLYNENIAEINKLDEDIKDSKWFSKERRQLKRKRDDLETENRLYERFQQDVDENFNILNSEEYQQHSTNRDFANPTREQLSEYDQKTQAGFQVDAEGNLVDVYGTKYDENYDFSKPEVTDKLGLYLSTPEAEREQAYDTDSAFAEQTWANIIKEGDEGSWSLLDPDEVGIYYTLLNTEGKEKAEQWLDGMRTELNRRESIKVSEANKKKYNEAGFWGKVGMNVASVPANVLGGALSFLGDVTTKLRGEEINPYASARGLQSYSQDVRGTQAENIDTATNNFNILGFSAGDVYQSLMSSVDSRVGAAIGSKAYGVLMGMGAASSAVKELYERGASESQMIGLGLLAGTAEMFFEKYSIDKLINMKNAKSVKDVIYNFLKQGGIEASEEAATELANTLGDMIFMGSNSELVKNAEAYKEQGLSNAAAYGKAVGDIGLKLWEAAAGGFISGGAMGGGASAVQTTTNIGAVNRLGNNIKSTEQTDKLMELAKEVSGVGGLANRVNKNASNRNVGLLASEVAYKTENNSVKEIRSALEKEGLSEKESKKMANAIMDKIEGRPITEEEQNMLETDERVYNVYGDMIMDENSAFNQRRGSLMDMGAMEQGYTGESSVSIGEVNEIAERMRNRQKFGNAMLNSQRNAENIAKVRDIANNFANTFNTKIGETNFTDVGQVAMDRANREIQAERQQKMQDVEGIRPILEKRFGEDATNNIIEGYDGSISAVDYAEGISDGYNYGWGHITEKGRTSEAFKMLTPEQQQYAIELGQKARANEDTRLETVAQQRQKVSAITEGLRANNGKYSGYSIGKITTDKTNNIAEFTLTKPDGTKVNLSAKATATNSEVYRAASMEILKDNPNIVKDNKDSKSNKKYGVTVKAQGVSTKRADISIKALDNISKALKVNIVVEDTQNEYNGYYDSSANEIHIDINAGGNSTLLFTASHELVHYIRNWNASKFTVLADYLMEQYAEKGVDIDSLIRAEQAKAFKATDGRVNMSFDEAYEEVVAQAMQRFLTDSNFIAKLNTLQQQDQSLVKRIISKLKEILNAVREAYSGLTTSDRASQYVKEMAEEADRLYELMEQALVSVSESSQTKEDLKHQYKDSLPHYTKDEIRDIREEVEKNFNIQSIHNYADVQKKVISKLVDLNFFDEIDPSDGSKAKIVTVSSNGMTVVINAKGIKETFGNGKRYETIPANLKVLKLAVVKQLPQVIKDAILTAENMPNLHLDGANKEYTYLNGTAVVGGKSLPVRIAIKVSPVKNKFWIHYVDIKNTDDNYQLGAKNAASAVTELSSAKDNVTQQTPYVNTDSKKKQYKDSEGHTLSAKQQEFFKDSKVRDENGNLLVMYHGTPNAGFTDFKTGTYFTQHKWYADTYQSQGASSLGYKKTANNPDTYAVYLNIKKPFDTRNKTERDIFYNEYYRQWGTGTDLMESGLPDWVDAMDLQEFLEEKGYDYDGLILDEGGTGGYGEDVKSRGLSYVIFDSAQVKDINNLNPTKAPDYRYQFKDISQQLNDWMEGGGKAYGEYNGKYFDLGTTPDVLLKHGAKKSNLIMHENVIVKVTGGKHSISLDEIAKLPAQLNDPILLFKGSVPNSFVALTELLDKNGNDVVVAIHINKLEKRNVVSRIASLYSKSDDYGDNRIISYVSNQINAGNLVDASIKKAPNWFTIRGLQLPKMVQTILDANSILAQKDEFVKTNQKISVTDGMQDRKHQYKDSYAPTFYSHMGKVIDDVKTAKMGANSVVSYLKGKGVKNEEIKWSGIEAFLEGKKSVTKEELQEFVAGSQLQIEEVVRDSKTDNRTKIKKIDRKTREVYFDGQLVDTLHLNEDKYWESEKNSGEFFIDNDDILNTFNNRYGLNTRWSDFKLDGGKNYKEIVFRLPNSTYSNGAMATHWGHYRDDSQGIIAHARIQDFDVDGKKMLFVEEIQSDWHNEGQKTGYKTKGVKTNQDIRNESADAFRDFIESDIMKSIENRLAKNGIIRTADIFSDLIDGKQSAYDTIVDNIGALTSKEKAFIENAVREERARNKQLENAPSDKAIPDAPFQSNYHEYVLKSLIRQAAENGYDSIGWTTADIQSERWSDEFAEGYRIEYDQDIPKFLNKYGKKWGAKVGSTTLDNGNEVWSMDITDAMRNSVLYEGQPKYQYKDSEGLDNRTLLVNALENVSLNEKEDNLLAEYKKRAKQLNEQEEKLAEIRNEIRELRFTEGKYDKAKIDKLTNESKEIAKTIDRYDKRLLQLEAATPLKRLLESERKKAYDRQKVKDRERLQDYKTGLNKTEAKNKIRQDVKKLSAILNRGTKERNVKNELRTAVSGALKLSDLLFSDMSDADIYRSGMMRISDNDRKYYEAYGTYLEQITNINDQLKDLRVSKNRTLTPEEEQRKETLIGRRKELYKMLDIAAKPLQDEFEKTRNTIESQSANEIKNALTELIDAYSELQNTKNPAYVQGAFDENVVEMLNSIRSKMDGKTISKMSLEELEKIHDAYKLVMHTVTQANKLMRDGKAQEVSEVSQNVISEVQGRLKRDKSSRPAIIDVANRLTWDEFKPIYAFRRIGSDTLTDLFKDMLNAESQYGADIRDAEKFISNIIEEYRYDKLNANKAKKITLAEGRTVEFTVPQMMSIYAYSKRDQAIQHMEDGGFIFADKEFKTDGKVLKRIHNQYDAIRIGQADVEIIKSAIGKDMVDFVDKAQAYLTDVMAAKGNEASRLLYGIDLFKEKVYFPLTSSKDFMQQQNQPASESSLKNSGMTKETVPQANNPIVLDNFMDVWSSHVNKMSVYHSFVNAIDNFKKVYDYTGYRNEDRSTSVKTMLNATYGKGVTEYISKLLSDINGGVQTESSKFGKLVSNFKKTKVAFSSSVVIQQPTAIMRAMALVDPKYFVKPKDKAKHSERWEQIKQYAPIAVIKEMGGYDVGGGRMAEQYFTNVKYKGFKDIVEGFRKDSNYRDEVFMKGASFADEVGWGIIWEACKNEIADKTNLAGEDLLKETGKRFTEVIQYTQVYDSSLSRSGFMRSTSEITKMATAFMGEPTTSLNMLIDSAIQCGRKKMSVKNMFRVMGATLAATIAANVFKSFVGAARDDDEEESYLEKYAQALSSNLLTDMIWNWVPFVRDIFSIIDGYDVERTDMSLIADIIKSIKELNKDTKPTIKKITDVVGSMLNLLGEPGRNIIREVYAAANIVKLATDDIPMGNFAEGFMEGLTGKQTTINVALDNGDFDRAKELIDAKVNSDKEKYILEGEKESDAIKKAKSNAKRTVSSHWKDVYLKAYKDKDEEEMKRIRILMNETGLYDKKVVETCREWVKDEYLK